ncbi:major facilitator superfamily domain-containing protein [Xylaria intraflava]|nr:major facilitator superfamily domain-containing protein [Xylaria intraflava]
MSSHGGNEKQNSALEQVPDGGPDLSLKDVEKSGDDSGHGKTAGAVPDNEYPTGLRLVLILASVFSAVFLVSLDRLIVTTAIPAITNEFNSLPDVGWYGSAYLLTSCAFQLLFGKLYSFYPIRVLYAGSVFLFEVGSALCGAAPNSVALIVGRAIQGVGSAGMLGGGSVVIIYAVPLAKRPLVQGLLGAIFGVSSILGPLVGGAFTSNVTWRWCFYINLPLGGVALVTILLLVRIPDRKETKLPTMAKLSQLDAAGTTALIPAIVSLLLALQWGGLTYAWNDRRIIALLTLSGVLGIAFILVQAFMPATATVPPRVFKQRSILAAFWMTIVIGAQQTLILYFLPIWLQAIMGVSPVNSGIRLLPTTLSVVVASLINGIFVTRIGYYAPSALLGTAISSIGSGLLMTLEVDTSTARFIGYQILYGFGLGLCNQTPSLVAQTVLPKKDVPIGLSLVFFSQYFGGAIFLPIGQALLNNQLLSRLAGIPGFSPSEVQTDGATDLVNSFAAEYHQDVLLAYNESLRTVFRVGLILATLSVLGAASLEWRSVKKEKEEPGNTASSDAETGNVQSGSAPSAAESLPETEKTATLQSSDAIGKSP